MLAFTMLLGRLEMYTLLILFHRKFWNGRSRW
jgi:trk system potassium uptake protein TrkH